MGGVGVRPQLYILIRMTVSRQFDRSYQRLTHNRFHSAACNTPAKTALSKSAEVKELEQLKVGTDCKNFT
jgi:hypothetical protein